MFRVILYNQCHIILKRIIDLPKGILIQTINSLSNQLLMIRVRSAPIEIPIIIIIIILKHTGILVEQVVINLALQILTLHEQFTMFRLTQQRPHKLPQRIWINFSQVLSRAALPTIILLCRTCSHCNLVPLRHHKTLLHKKTKCLASKT